MFERYTEKARRTIFFGRFEASQFGSPNIETEHLLLGMLREDTAMADYFLRSHAAAQSIRRQVEAHSLPQSSKSISVDLPLSHQSKRVLAYGAEEADRLGHRHIGTEHLLLGLLREETCFAARLLNERGVTLESVRARMQRSGRNGVPSQTVLLEKLREWASERGARGGLRAVTQQRFPDRSTHLAIYAIEEPERDDELSQMQKRIHFLFSEMERAIASHEFEKARTFSDEERMAREDLRRFCEQHNLKEPPPPLPRLCIEIVGDERFPDIRKRCDDHLADNIPEVWLLDPESKCVYTVTKADGLREFRGEILVAANLPFELNVTKIFD